MPHRFETLQKYGGAAKSALPRLKAWRWDFRKPTDRAQLEETIKAIENDTNPMKLTSLADLVDKRLAGELASAKSDEQRAALCRKLIKDHPGDYFFHAAALKKLVAMLGDGAFDDVLAAVGHPDDRLGATALELAAAMDGKWVAQLATAKHEKLAGVLAVLGRRGDRKTLPAAKKYLKDEDEVVRAAAIEAVGAIGGQKVIPMLADLLVKGDSPRERGSAANAILAAKDIDKAGALVVAVLGKTSEEASRCAVIGVLGRIGGAKALAAIVETTTDESRDVRRAAFEALGSSPDPKALDVLLTMVEKIQRGRNRGEIFSACLRRVISGDIPAERKLSLLERIATLDPRGSGARGFMEELRWTPTTESLAVAEAWMQKRDKKQYGNISDYAARAAVAIAVGMNANDPAQRKAAVEVVKKALTITTDEETVAAAKAFIEKHGK